jgi:hypothetical protein
VKFRAEAQSLKEELDKANSRLLSMEEVTNCSLTQLSFWVIYKLIYTCINLIQEHKRETEQLKHSSEMNINALENKLR